jgi:hypothetical protein
VPCILPFAATFRFSPQKSGRQSDPANRGVVLLQVVMGERFPHTNTPDNNPYVLCGDYCRVLILLAGVSRGHPFKTDYLPLNYSGNPGVNGVSYRDANGNVQHTDSHTK